ncbi:hypothetical protein [Promicromonospora sp. NPDC023987]|uniref:hypothetical protein n=1 Tax=Promicromonospora sp. NPDC023987 TaxID=3155360 RepID=UPI0033D247FB
MVAITVEPFILRDVDLMIGTDNYEAHTSQVEFTPTVSAVSWTGLANNTVTSQTTATWGCTIALAQDWGTLNSLSQYLMDNEGLVVPCTFTPASGQGSFAANITITPGAIGGTAGAFAVATVTLGSTKPVFTPAV